VELDAFAQLPVIRRQRIPSPVYERSLFGGTQRSVFQQVSGRPATLARTADGNFRAIAVEKTRDPCAVDVDLLTREAQAILLTLPEEPVDVADRKAELHCSRRIFLRRRVARA
jgi:hypothetical protein